MCQTSLFLIGLQLEVGMASLFIQNGKVKICASSTNNSFICVSQVYCFSLQVLGKRLKYSGCDWPENVTTLEQGINCFILYATY